MWAKIILILGGLTGVFVSEIFDTGALTLGCSIFVLLVGIFSRSRLTELAMEKHLLGKVRRTALRKKETGGPTDDDG